MASDLEARLATRAAARLVVALARSPFQRLVSGTQPARERISSALVPSIAEVADAWEAASRAVREAVDAALPSYPEPSGVLSDPGVVAALDGFAEAASRARRSVEAAWAVGRAEGSRLAASQVRALGLRLSKAPSRSVSPSLLADLDRNAAESRQRVADALVGGDLDRALAEGVRRARLTAKTAGYRGARTSQVESLRLSGVRRKMWVTRFGPGTCAVCASLHGHVAPIGGGFRHSASFGSAPSKPYLDLGGPPRHPNCRCLVVPLPEEEEPGVSPSTMKRYARTWWRQNRG